ncbi:branched-chain amino acid aminotransferase [Natronincola peptidivorans]|uniref:Branched-chain amino acid aminotransferase n=1 Tax=Natronincola peptidivorans TaxID=426128 RepID=A0A1H9ZVS1_9FIRM|nr:aminotransferase class IV [Natronincola peptidivorans]SES85871.1 branched-chain amino acid aminotransferase [Natronincola peptidivorans]
MKTNYKEVHRDFFLMNGKMIAAEEFNPEAITKTTSVYEVIRIIDGVPLFLEEHMERLNKSFHLLGFDYTIDEKNIEKEIHQLIEINGCYDYNMKVIVNSLDSISPNTFVFFIESNYPTEEQYRIGVDAILYAGERETPNAKVVAKSFRQQIQEEIKKAHAFEAILVDQHQQITEGSRSNIFVVKGNKLYTAPSEKVLKGVTRKRILDLCRKMSFPIEEAPISIDLLKKADGVFMTGTSPKVLPIFRVDYTEYASAENPIIKSIMKAYDDVIEDYIHTHKKL